jgi:hypothetical protein
VSLGYVPAGIDPATYAGYASSRFRGIWWGVGVFKAKLVAVNGDIGAAIQAYNGSGPSSVTYAQNADQTAVAENWTTLDADLVASLGGQGAQDGVTESVVASASDDVPDYSQAGNVVPAEEDSS